MMADYRLPMDEDGVKYHGVEDDGDLPGQVVYGADNARRPEVIKSDDGKLKTKDVDVLEELLEIKQQQNEILQRLNEPIDTQLTGSNAEEEILTDVILEPDEEVSIGIFDVFDYSSYSFAVFSVDITRDDAYLISVRLRASTLNRLDNPEDATEFELKSRGVTDKKDVTAPKIEVSINNISNASMEISRMFLYKHR